MDLKVIYELSEANSGMTDIERLTTIYAYLSSVLELGVPGAIAEVGCNIGYTSAFLQKINHSQSSGLPREVHVYDSFQGLPTPGTADQYLAEGQLSVSTDEFCANVKSWGVPLPEIHAGWFDETLEDSLPDEIAFCYLDGDFYESTLTGLQAVVPRLSPGGVLIVDDYCDLEYAPRSWDGLPGVKKACDEYFGASGLRVQPLVGIGDLSFALYRSPL